MLYKIITISEANNISHFYSKNRFYKVSNKKDIEGIFQNLKSLPSGKKLTRFIMNERVYFGLGWNVKEGAALFSMVGCNKNSIRSDYTYKKGAFKKLDKLILNIKNS